MLRVYKKRQIALGRLGAIIVCMHNYQAKEKILTKAWNFKDKWLSALLGLSSVISKTR